MQEDNELNKKDVKLEMPLEKKLAIANFNLLVDKLQIDELRTFTKDLFLHMQHKEVLTNSLLKNSLMREVDELLNMKGGREQDDQSI